MQSTLRIAVTIRLLIGLQVFEECLSVEGVVFTVHFLIEWRHKLVQLVRIVLAYFLVFNTTCRSLLIDEGACKLVDSALVHFVLRDGRSDKVRIEIFHELGSIVVHAP